MAVCGGCHSRFRGNDHKMTYYPDKLGEQALPKVMADIDSPAAPKALY